MSGVEYDYGVFAGLPPHQRHSDTSRESAIAALPRMGKSRRRVYELLKSAGASGATDEQMQRTLDMNPNTQRPRRRELQLGGLVKDSGRRRNTLSGTLAVVWVVT